MDAYGNYQQPMSPNWNGGQNSYMNNYQNTMNNQAQAQQNNYGAKFNPPNRDGMKTQRPNLITGRVVNSIDEVVPQEVPMDGNWTFFPVANGTEIYAMSWNRQGTIDANRYILEEKNPKQGTSNIANDEVASMILARLDELSHQIEQIKNTRSNHPKKPNKPKQEPVREEAASNV